MSEPLSESYKWNSKLSHQFLFHLGLDVPRQSEEGLLHIYGRLGGCLHELDSVLDGELLSPLFGHLKMRSIKHYSQIRLMDHQIMVQFGYWLGFSRSHLSGHIEKFDG